MTKIPAAERPLSDAQREVLDTCPARRAERMRKHGCSPAGKVSRLPPSPL